MKKQSDFTFEFIAMQCFENFAQTKQWLEIGHFENAYQYRSQAKILLELLEVKICGSIGGFDKFQQGTENKRYGKPGYVMDLFHRFLWIIDHHTNIKDSDRVFGSSGPNLKQLIDYFENIRTN